MNLSDQVVIITGGGRGLGREIALAFAKEGAAVCICGRNRNSLDETVEELKELKAPVMALACDVSEEAEVDRLVDAAVERLGAPTVLVNNAGIAGPTSPVAELRLTEWTDTLAVNLTGAFLCARAVLKYMIPRRQGRIVNIASIAGARAYKLRAPYAVSKWGMIGLSRTLAAELGEFNIQVNAICPGPVRGERMDSVIEKRSRQRGVSPEDVTANYLSSTALKRFVEPGHVAQQVILLASPAGASITGQVFTIDCGFDL